MQISNIIKGRLLKEGYIATKGRVHSNMEGTKKGCIATWRVQRKRCIAT